MIILDSFDSQVVIMSSHLNQYKKLCFTHTNTGNSAYTYQNRTWSSWVIL